MTSFGRSMVSELVTAIDGTSVSQQLPVAYHGQMVPLRIDEHRSVQEKGIRGHKGQGRAYFGSDTIDRCAVPS
jgi:hypothetical protein